MGSREVLLDPLAEPRGHRWPGDRESHESAERGALGHGFFVVGHLEVFEELGKGIKEL